MKRSHKLTALVTSLVFLTSGPVNTASAANAPQGTPLEILNAAASIAGSPASTLLADLMQSPLNVGRSAGPEPKVKVPSSSEELVNLTGKENSRITVELPFGSQAAPAVTVTGSAVSFDSANGSIQVALPKNDGSLQLAAIIQNSSAPNRFQYKLGLPAGGYAKLQINGGVTLFDSANRYVGAVAPAWAVDANGKRVPTNYEVNGLTITQIVDHKSRSFVYPIVADPWLGIDLIDKTAWDKDTLRVFPTLWGRISDINAEYYGWQEVLAKTPGNRENSSSMRDQFYCHFDVVRVANPFKESWNLDLYRINVPYPTMILRRCNP